MVNAGVEKMGGDDGGGCGTRVDFRLVGDEKLAASAAGSAARSAAAAVFRRVRAGVSSVSRAGREGWLSPVSVFGAPSRDME